VGGGTAPPPAEDNSAETVGISVGAAAGGLCVIAVVVFAVFRCRKPSDGGGDGEIDPETGVKTPKDKRPSLAMLMNQTTQNPLKNGAESFVDNQATEVVKTQRTKEEMLKAEKEKIEKLKIQLKENGMDPSEIENEIKKIMDAERPKYTKEPNESDMSEPAALGDDASSARRLSNVNNANNTTLKRRTSNRTRDVEQIDFELPGHQNALEIDETEMKSMKSEANFRYKGKLTGVQDMSQVRESQDKVGKSLTDDKLIAGTKVNKNPKLETTKGAELGALASVDFDSEKQVNKESVEIDIDSVADLANPDKGKNS